MQSRPRAPPACSLLLPAPGGLLQLRATLCFQFLPSKGPGLTFPRAGALLCLGLAPSAKVVSHFRSLLATVPPQAPSGSSRREKAGPSRLGGSQDQESSLPSGKSLDQVTLSVCLLLVKFLPHGAVWMPETGHKENCRLGTRHFFLGSPSRVSARSLTQAKATQPEEERSQPLLQDRVPWHFGLTISPSLGLGSKRNQRTLCTWWP